jgi:actin-related protein
MHLEFDHVDPRNREDTAQGLRLRCRTHNQHEAERIFGTEFMERKREEARLAAERKREEKARAAEERERARAEKVRAEEEREKVRAEERERARVQAAANAELDGQIQDVLSALRGMGIRGDHARRLAERARSLEGATLPDRIRAALEFHGECIRQSPKPRRAAYA